MIQQAERPLDSTVVSDASVQRKAVCSDRIQHCRNALGRKEPWRTHAEEVPEDDETEDRGALLGRRLGSGTTIVEMPSSWPHGDTLPREDDSLG